MVEDLSVFLDTDDFATAATYTPNGGAAVTVNVIFDRAYLEQLGVSSTHPVALGDASDFSGWTNQDALVINGATFRIFDSRAMDDGAMVQLDLEAQ